MSIINYIDSLHLPFEFLTFNEAKKGRGSYKEGMKYYLEGYAAILIRDTLNSTGFVETGKLSEALLIVGSAISDIKSLLLKSWQKTNHYTKTLCIGSKEGYHKIISAAEERLKMKMSFYPETYLMPSQYQSLKHVFNTSDYWIVKPSSGSRGSGIHIIDQLPKKFNRVVVQRYVKNPFLINGLKFDLRFYVAVTSLDPLLIYIFDDGLVRIATQKYKDNKDEISNLAVHLTNYSINKDRDGFVTTNDLSKDGTGNKWSHKPLWPYLMSNGFNVDDIKQKIYDSMVTVIISSVKRLKGQINHRRSFELFGFDVMLDTDQNVYILEVNISPAMGTASELDRSIKAPVVKSMFDLACIKLPIPEAFKFEKALSGYGDQKVTEFANIIQFEVAQTKLGRFKLAYPTPQSVKRLGSLIEKATHLDKEMMKYVNLTNTEKIQYLESRRESFNDFMMSLSTK